MSTLVTVLAILLTPLVLAVLFALWDDNFSARHRRHIAEMTRMQSETDAYCVARRRESEAIRAEGERRMMAWMREQRWGWRPDSSKPRRPRGVHNEAPRMAIVPITPDGGPLPHGGVCRSCGAGIAWRGGSYRNADGDMQAHQPQRCTCGGEIEVLA